jgi:copper chaperone CopZ
MIRNAFLILAALALVVPEAPAIAPPDRVYEVETTLISCAVCRPKIKAIFETIPDVKSVEWDLVAKKAIVTMNGDKVLTKATLEKAFETSKYIVNSVTERKATASKPATDTKRS